MSVFEKKLKLHEREVYNHLKSVGYGTVCYAIEWFTTMFIVTSPGDLSCCVVDLLLGGVEDALLRVGLAVMSVLKEEICSMSVDQLQVSFREMVLTVDPLQVMTKALGINLKGRRKILQFMVSNIELMPVDQEFVNTMRPPPLPSQISTSEPDLPSIISHLCPIPSSNVPLNCELPLSSSPISPSPSPSPPSHSYDPVIPTSPIHTPPPSQENNQTLLPSPHPKQRQQRSSLSSTSSSTSTFRMKLKNIITRKKQDQYPNNNHNTNNNPSSHSKKSHNKSNSTSTNSSSTSSSSYSASSGLKSKPSHRILRLFSNTASPTPTTNNLVPSLGWQAFSNLFSNDSSSLPPSQVLNQSFVSSLSVLGSGSGGEGGGRADLDTSSSVLTASRRKRKERHSNRKYWKSHREEDDGFFEELRSYEDDSQSVHILSRSHHHPLPSYPLHLSPKRLSSLASFLSSSLNLNTLNVFLQSDSNPLIPIPIDVSPLFPSTQSQSLPPQSQSKSPPLTPTLNETECDFESDRHSFFRFSLPSGQIFSIQFQSNHHHLNEKSTKISTNQKVTTSNKNNRIRQELLKFSTQIRIVLDIFEQENIELKTMENSFVGVQNPQKKRVKNNLTLLRFLPSLFFGSITGKIQNEKEKSIQLNEKLLLLTGSSASTSTHYQKRKSPHSFDRIPPNHQHHRISSSIPIPSKPLARVFSSPIRPLSSQEKKSSFVSLTQSIFNLTRPHHHPPSSSPRKSPPRIDSQSLTTRTHPSFHSLRDDREDFPVLDEEEEADQHHSQALEQAFIELSLSRLSTYQRRKKKSPLLQSNTTKNPKLNLSSSKANCSFRTQESLRRALSQIHQPSSLFQSTSSQKFPPRSTSLIPSSSPLVSSQPSPSSNSNIPSSFNPTSTTSTKLSQVKPTLPVSLFSVSSPFWAFLKQSRFALPPPPQTSNSNSSSSEERVIKDPTLSSSSEDERPIFSTQDYDADKDEFTKQELVILQIKRQIKQSKKTQEQSSKGTGFPPSISTHDQLTNNENESPGSSPHDNHHPIQTTCNQSSTLFNSSICNLIEDWFHPHHSLSHKSSVT